MTETKVHDGLQDRRVLGDRALPEDRRASWRMKTETAAEFEAISEGHRLLAEQERERYVVLRSGLVQRGRVLYVVERASDGWWLLRRIRRRRTQARLRLALIIQNATDPTLIERMERDNSGWHERYEGVMSWLARVTKNKEKAKRSKKR